MLKQIFFVARVCDSVHLKHAADLGCSLRFGMVGFVLEGYCLAKSQEALNELLTPVDLTEDEATVAAVTPTLAGLTLLLLTTRSEFQQWVIPRTR